MRLKAINILHIIAINILHTMPPQRRNQGFAPPHPPTPQRFSRVRLLIIRAIENDFSQSRRHQKRNDPLSEVIVDEAFDENKIKKSIDSDASFIRFRHDIEHTIFIHKRNDNERQTKVRRKNEIQFQEMNIRKATI